MLRNKKIVSGVSLAAWLMAVAMAVTGVRLVLVCIPLALAGALTGALVTAWLAKDFVRAYLAGYIRGARDGDGGPGSEIEDGQPRLRVI